MVNLTEIKSSKKNVLIGFEECPFCRNAVSLLNEKKVAFDYIKRGQELGLETEIKTQLNHRTYPMIFLKGEWIGGFDNLKRHKFDQ